MSNNSNKLPKQIKTSLSKEDVVNELMTVIEIMKKGYIDPLEVQQEIHRQGYNWSRGKVNRYLKIAQNWITTYTEDIKKVADQRHLLIKKSEGIEQELWRDIQEREIIREQAIAKIKNGKSIEDLNYEEQEMLSLGYARIKSMNQKDLALIIKAQERQSELYGFRNDKTILIQNESSDTVKYMDSMNKEIIKRYRDNYDEEKDTIEVEFEEIKSEEEQMVEEFIEDINE